VGLPTSDPDPESNRLERRARAGDSPVGEGRGAVGSTRVPQDTCNPAGIYRDHPVRLNTTHRPIVNEYREGKVKSTPEGE
jgi:hypothetical protein